MIDAFQEKEIYLREAFQNGSISEETYFSMVKQLEEKRRKSKRFFFTRNLKLLFYPLVIIGSIVLYILVIYVFTFPDHETVESLNNLPDPVQTPASSRVWKKIWGKEVTIDFVAEYELQGRVVASSSYMPWSVRWRLQPKDITVVWWFLANDEYLKHINWMSLNNRFVFAKFDGDSSWFNSVGWISAIGTHYSNNHLIPANGNIERLFHRIHRNDYIKITGYLAHSYWDSWEIGTSTVRTDTWDGACESIYVTDIKWLNEK